MAAMVEVLLWVTLCLLATHQASCSNFRHVGCYHVADGSEGLRYNYGTLRLEQCASGCNSDGYPFLALRQGRDCLCVMNYGQAGAAAFSAMCNQTCVADGVTFLCGGVQYEDIYYAVDTDSRMVLPLREPILHNEVLTFKDARKSCVMQNGDLPIVVNQAHLLSIWNVARNANGSAVWIGAYRTTWGAGIFQWAGLNLNQAGALLDLTVNSSIWSQSNTFSGDCVVLLTSEMKLKVVSCDVTLPYVCHQVPPPPTTPAPTVLVTSPTTTAAPAELDAWASEDMQKALFIVLPIFFILVFGSCFGYCGHRLWRYYRRRQRLHARLAMLRKAQTEFEPDTKPLAFPYVDAESSRPVTARDVTVDQRSTYRKTPLSEKGRMMEPPVPEVCVTNEVIQSRRPISAMVTPPPPIARVGTSSSKRSGLDSRQSTALPGDWPEVGVDHDDVDNDDIDFTKLSIQDILYVKMLLGDDDHRRQKKSKKKRRIIIA